MTPALTTDDVCELMRCKAATLRHMVAVGEFPEPFRRGRPWIWMPATVDAVLEGHWSPTPQRPTLGVVA